MNVRGCERNKSATVWATTGPSIVLGSNKPLLLLLLRIGCFVVVVVVVVFVDMMYRGRCVPKEYTVMKRGKCRDDGKLSKKTQTCCVLFLALDRHPQDERSDSLDLLVRQTVPRWEENSI